MKTGRVYMHQKALDTAVRVLNADSSLVQWLNLGYVGEPFDILDPVKLILAVSDESEWVDITDTFAIKRTKPGLP